ncbi:MAG: DmsC/YnfH family molybdoenzyme membrane anchor subunit [Arenimonas sp.]
MHPAFSVIFFTSISGAGFGLMAWLGWLAALDQLPSRAAAIVALVLGAVLAAAGLCSSLLHLGKPLRAWRSFSQWRSSWLSREGVVSVASFLPALFLGWSLLGADAMPVSTPAMRAAGTALLLLSVATVACTAMIYASLKPIPAWRHPLVLPVYLLFAAFTGGLLLASVIAVSGGAPGPWTPALAGGAALALGAMKFAAWRAIDTGVMPATRNQALGLPHARAVSVFERPHTEANYLLKEMGYVLARRHARRIRLLGLLLFTVLPVLLVAPLLAPVQSGAAAWLLAASASALLGAFVERWLFFAQARHLVTLYY